MWTRLLQKQDLKERRKNVAHIDKLVILLWRRREWNAPPSIVLSFFKETRQPDKLAIRKVIWQCVPRAFAAPLHLFNIMKPFSASFPPMLREHAGCTTASVPSFCPSQRDSLSCESVNHHHRVPVILIKDATRRLSFSNLVTLSDEKCNCTHMY